MSEAFSFILNTSFGLVLAICSVQSAPTSPLLPAAPATIYYECSAALPNPLDDQTSLVFVAAGTLTGPYLEAAGAQQPQQPTRYPYFTSSRLPSTYDPTVSQRLRAHHSPK